jgi:3-hydroxybutyryl-CoA dehydrogenase
MNYALDGNQTKGRVLTGVIGAGTMGRGIAQISAAAGNPTIIFDSSSSMLEDAKAAIAKILARNVEKGICSQQDVDATLKNLTFTTEIRDLSSCELAIEAIIEDMAVKKELFHQLDEVLSQQAVIVTNTSSLSVTSLAAGTKNPERFAGLHFFNPVPLMKVVEVIKGPLTHVGIIDGLKKWVELTGHKAVTAIDSPGFVVNHAGRGYGTEALRILGECIASVEATDEIMRGTGLFKMGPFELMDLIGLDVSHKVMESIYAQYYQEPRYRPSPLARNRVEANLLGRKTGRGFYVYDSDKPKKHDTDRGNYDETPLMRKVWIQPMNPERMQRIEGILPQGTKIENQPRPGDQSICIVTPIGLDTTSFCKKHSLDPEKTLAIDSLFPMDKTVTMMATPRAMPEIIGQMMSAIRHGGRHGEFIEDSPGFVAQRMIAMIVNIGCDIVQQGITTPYDLDQAVRLGLGYQHGPLAMGDRFGAGNILEILENLFDYYKDPRYRPSPWLKRRVALGMSLTEFPRYRREMN